MSEYVASVIVDGRIEMFVIDETNNLRIFDDKTVAETAAKALSPVYNIMTKDEFIAKYSTKDSREEGSEVFRNSGGDTYRPDGKQEV